MASLMSVRRSANIPLFISSNLVISLLTLLILVAENMKTERNWQFPSVTIGLIFLTEFFRNADNSVLGSTGVPDGAA